MDRTVQQRIKKQREARANEGWVEVRVWVPTKSDAENIQKLAAHFRADAQELNGLKQLEGVKKMHHANYQQIAEAISHQGSSAFSTESGAIQTLMSDLARDGYIEDFARAFVLFARAYPGNASFVEQSAPAKIMNHYWIRNQQIDSDQFNDWAALHPEWADTLKAQIRNPVQFAFTVGEMATAMKRRH